jgi:hypothetical protein
MTYRTAMHVIWSFVFGLWVGGVLVLIARDCA